MRKNSSKLKDIKVIGGAIVLFIIALVFGCLVINQSVASALDESVSSKGIPVFLFSRVIEEGRLLYIGEDLSGKRYAVENSGHSLIFSGDNVTFVQIASNDGQWYIKDVLEAPRN